MTSEKVATSEDRVFLLGRTPEKCPRAFLLQTIDLLFAAMRSKKLLPRGRAAVLTVNFVGADAMKKMNRRFRGKNAVTDVLSFEQPSPSRAPAVFLGDLVVCGAVLSKQAREQGHSAKDEAAVLLAHGLLHLLGYDHERSAREEKKMRALEKALLESLKGRRLSSGLLARNRVKG